jgi:hypothetical protein
VTAPLDRSPETAAMPASKRPLRRILSGAFVLVLLGALA